MSKHLQAALAAAILHAREEYPREACGIVIVLHGRELYVPCRNIAIEATQQFVLCPQDYEAASQRGEVLAVVHSHPGASCQPSRHDLAVHAVSGIDWWIVGLPAGRDGPAESTVLPHAVRPPLFGRPFYFGVSDCYALVRDWYAQQRDIDLPDFLREDRFWERGDDLFRDNFARAGFERQPLGALPQHGDVLLMQISTSAMPNHCAVWLSGDRIAHHMPGRLSGTEMFSRFYRDRTVAVLRYRGDE